MLKRQQHAIVDDQQWGMGTARLLTNCSKTLRNIHTNARENITRTRAKRKASYFFVAHSVHRYKRTGYPVACQTGTQGSRTIAVTILDLGAGRAIGDERHVPGKNTCYTFYIGTLVDGSVLPCPQLVSNSIIRPRSESHTEYSLPATFYALHHT